MKLIIVRHGQTEENVRGIVQGHLPGKLTTKGISQANEVANSLKDTKIDHIYSSDLARSADTAKIIAKHHKDTPIEFTKDLRELYLGSWQGKRKEELGLPKGTSLGVNFPEDGESFEELIVRARNFINKLKSDHQGDTVLLVAHKKINRAIMSVLLDVDREDIEKIPFQGHTEIITKEV